MVVKVAVGAVLAVVLVRAFVGPPPARDPEAALALAQLYLALSDPEKAIQAAQQAVAEAPSSPAAHEVLISALKSARKTTEEEAEHRRWSERR